MLPIKIIETHHFFIRMLWITTELAVGYAPRSHNDLTAIRKMKHTPSIPMSRNRWDLLDRYSEKLRISKNI
ncbi:MAG: hypothetical protein KJP23_21005 [Deltaproteobacteria bacterium]|nr:hypothetical protein [Deltaproteobacteria bacterium]